MAKTGHPNFDYTLQGLWRGAAHSFSVTGNHSGASFGAGDAQTFMEGAASPMALSFGLFIDPSILVTEARYYDGSTAAPVWEATYTTEVPAPDAIQPSGLGLSSDPTAAYLPLEVCTLLYARVGSSSTSKPVYCRKYLRAVPLNGVDASGDEVVLTVNDLGTAAAVAVGSGAWYGSRVYCSPNGAQADGDGWLVDTYPVNHQVPRGKKRKKTTTSDSSVVSTIEQILGLASVA